MFEQAGRSRAYRRRQKYLKDKRRKQIAQYPGWYNRNFYYNEERVNHIQWLDYSDTKSFYKKCARRAWRRSKDESYPKGCLYKKYYTVD